MTFRRASFAVVLAVAALAFLSPHVSAQDPGTYQCGDVQLVFRNPDLQTDAQGFLHASGKFFIQFQAIGAKADQIKVFAFSFGPYTTDFNESACQTPVWVTGAYIQNYRADRNPDDGFLIGINTTLVPDGTYAAAIHAYDGANTELARFWVKAIVDNCDPQPTPAQERCGTDPAQLVKHDIVAPWPLILPGDGKPVLSSAQMTLEFGEPLSGLKVQLDGRDITAAVTPWEGRTYDDDAIPDYGPSGVGGILLPPCSQEPPQTCAHWGPAYQWNGRVLTASDVVHVEATDLAGNVAVKDIHIGSAVAGGAITGDLPNLQVTVDAINKTLAAGQSVTFRFTMVNSGGGEAHAFTDTSAPAGWKSEFLPHEPIPPGKTKVQELTVTAPASAAPGMYKVNASINYQQGGEEKRNEYVLGLTVGTAGPTGSAAAATPSDSGKKSPLGLLALPAIGLAGALARAGRRTR